MGPFQSPSLEYLLSPHDHEEDDLVSTRILQSKAVHALATNTKDAFVSFVANTPSLDASIAIHQFEGKNNGTFNEDASSLDSFVPEEEEDKIILEMEEFAKDISSGKARGIEELINKFNADTRQQEDEKQVEQDEAVATFTKKEKKVATFKAKGKNVGTLRKKKRKSVNA